MRWWEPLLIPGLLQTAEYARAILAADPETTEDSWTNWSPPGWNGRAILDQPSAADAVGGAG